MEGVETPIVAPNGSPLSEIYDFSFLYSQEMGSNPRAWATITTFKYESNPQPIDISITDVQITGEGTGQVTVTIDSENTLMELGGYVFVIPENPSKC